MRKCVYCGRKIDEESMVHAHVHTRDFGVCNESCKEKTERYVLKDKKVKMFLYVILFFVSLGIIANTFIRGNEMTYYFCLLIAGIVLFFFPYPFSAFESFEHVSIRSSTIACRVFGLVSFILSAVLLLKMVI